MTRNINEEFLFAYGKNIGYLINSIGSCDQLQGDHATPAMSMHIGGDWGGGGRGIILLRLTTAILGLRTLYLNGITLKIAIETQRLKTESDVWGTDVSV